MLCGKVPGPDAIDVEVLKLGRLALLTKLTELFKSFWDNEILPQEFKDATNVHLHKKKGNRRSCDNHGGISLLATAGKIQPASS